MYWVPLARRLPLFPLASPLFGDVAAATLRGTTDL
jgi:hypothetical protein